MLSGPSRPVARHALSTVPALTRLDGPCEMVLPLLARGVDRLRKEKAVSQPGLHMTRRAEVGGAVVPPSC